MPTKKIIQTVTAITLVLVLFRFFHIPFSAHSLFKRPFDVRVRILRDTGSFELSSKKKINVYDPASGAIVWQSPRRNDKETVEYDPDGIRLGGELMSVKELRIPSPRGGLLSLNGVVFRGDMKLIRTPSGIDVINIVGLEDYLKGVVPREVSHYWPFSTLKAQAIASRSYAVYEAKRRKGRTYDLTADIFSQVYGGKSSERWRTSWAVDSTNGRVLVFDGKVMPAYFHSCCGGHTQSSAKLWDLDLRPLSGTFCDWCKWSPYFRWRVKLSAKDITDGLQDKGYLIGRIDDISTGKRDASGRVEYVRVRSGNKWVEMPTRDFRSVVGRSAIKSSNFHVKKYPLFYVFSGYGWGHGVGMCQWGAFGLGLRRWSAENILKHYYPGTSVSDLPDVI